MKISVVVPAFNEEKLISGSLSAIREARASFTAIGWESELIVCDNNSTDRTAQLASEAGAQVIFEPINQIARARNTGASIATGDWLVFIDADSHPSPALFADVAEAIKTGRYIAGGSTVRLQGNYPMAEWLLQSWNCFSRVTRNLAGSFIFCDTQSFRQLGGFNQKLYVAEELDLTYRLKKLGRQLRKRLIILHKYPLVTSARKLHLYTAREYFVFMLRAMMNPRKSVRDPKRCFAWYDGRR